MCARIDREEPVAMGDTPVMAYARWAVSMDRLGVWLPLHMRMRVVNGQAVKGFGW